MANVRLGEPWEPEASTVSEEPHKKWAELIRLPGRSKQLTTSHVVSVGIHVLPWLVPLILSLLHLGQFEFKDQEGELVVPIDMVDDPTPNPQPAPVDNNPPGGNQPGGGASWDAAPDAKIKDAEGDAEPDAGTGVPEIEGGVAYLDPNDGGAGGVGFDPASQLGDLGKMSAGTNNVTVTINFGVIRTHPLGPRVQPILLAIPEWKQFMGGSSIDPYRDTDWMMISGPSLLDTTKDVMIIHYSASDADVEKGIGTVSAAYSQGGPVDVGVKGVHVWRAHVHGAERAFIRAQSHCVVIVPWANAKTFAQVASRSACTLRSPPGEALRASFKRPGGSVAQIPASISELRMWLVPRNSDSGADLYAEGDTPDPASATKAADDLRNTVTSVNSLMVKLATAGVLSGFDVKADGSVVKVHLPGNKDQVEAIINLAGARVGVAPPAPSGNP